MTKNQQWLPIESAPREGKILGWCNHEAGPYYLEEGKRLTSYGSHVESYLVPVEDGPNILEWGGGWHDSGTWEDPTPTDLPDWWFLVGSDFERPANPTHWMPIAAPPANGVTP